MNLGNQEAGHSPHPKSAAADSEQGMQHAVRPLHSRVELHALGGRDRASGDVGARARARESHSSSDWLEQKFQRGITICPCSHGTAVSWRRCGQSHDARERVKLPWSQRIKKERDDIMHSWRRWHFKTSRSFWDLLPHSLTPGGIP